MDGTTDSALRIATALLFDQLDAAILGAAIVGRIVRNRLGLPQALCRETRSTHVMRNQPCNHCLRALFRERLVGCGAALIVRVAFDVQLLKEISRQTRRFVTELSGKLEQFSANQS